MPITEVVLRCLKRRLLTSYLGPFDGSVIEVIRNASSTFVILTICHQGEPTVWQNKTYKTVDLDILKISEICGADSETDTERMPSTGSSCIACVVTVRRYLAAPYRTAGSKWFQAAEATRSRDNNFLTTALYRHKLSLNCLHGSYL